MIYDRIIKRKDLNLAGDRNTGNGNGWGMP
jgi:hypothetical protein